MKLSQLKGENFDQNVGIGIVQRALTRPCRQIAENAGKEGAVIVARLLDPPSGKVNTNIGYDAQNDVYVDMFEAGIIDPTKVVRTALLDASSVAGLMITTESLVTDEPEREPPDGGMGGGMGGGGMGGMGGMGGGMF